MLKISSLNKILNFYILILLVAYLVILIQRINTPPTGYLHSWNQITTLVNVDDLASDSSHIGYQRDVMTRVTWESKDRFRIFEEFPLYAFISAKLSNIGIPTFLGARIISLFSFFLLGYSIYRLTKSNNLKQDQSALYITTILLLSCSPYLFYGQAIMSDMAMTSCLIFGITLLSEYYSNKQKKLLIFGIVFLILASLFKSFAIFWFPLVFFIFYNNTRPILSLLKAILVIALMSSPILSWHIWCSLQDGNQEYLSHSITNKLSFIFSSGFPLIILKRLCLFFGECLVLFISLYYFLQGRIFEKLRLNDFIPPLIIPSLLLGFLYLLATADKLSDHDYYYLPIAALLTPCIALFISYILRVTESNNFNKLQIVLLIILCCGSFFALKRFEKATRANFDVLECSEIIKIKTSESDLIAIYTDVSRYNSLAYYAERKGVVVENTAFPISKYKSFGADFLLLNLEENESKSFKETFLIDFKNLNNVFSLKLKDFRKRDRICELFKFN